MERDSNRHHSESLVRQLTEERERFVSAWHHGAGGPELSQIRKNIQKLNDLLWDATRTNINTPGRKSASESTRDSQNRQGNANHHP